MFGVVIISMTINLIAGLGRQSSAQSIIEPLETSER
jgi:hypothetical protein